MHEAPKRLQVGPKMRSRNASKKLQVAPKTDQVRLKFAPRGSKLDPKYVQERFGHILEAIWTLLMRLRRRCLAQEASKRRPRGSKWSPRGAQEAAS